MTALIPTSPIERIRATGALLHAHLEAQVHAQRIAGASWTAIATQLGVSRQAARQRWGYLDDLPVQIRLSDGLCLFTSSTTGAVVGRAQTEQVEAGGLIVEHHPAIGA